MGPRRKPTIYDHKTWLEMRKEARIKHRFGASQIATALDLNPYESSFTLFHRMMGNIPPQGETMAMRKGKHMESFIAQVYQEQSGKALSTPGEYAVYQHPTIDYIFATPDYEQYEDGLMIPVECKNTEAMNGWRWRGDEFPIEYDVQLYVQGACMEVSRGVLAAMVGNSFEIREREFRQATWNWIVEGVDKFRWRLAKDRPPPIDGSESSSLAVKQLHPDDNGRTIELSKEGARYLDRWQRWREIRIKADKTEKTMKNRLLAEIGNNTWAISGDSKLSLKTQTTKNGTTRVLREVGVCHR